MKNKFCFDVGINIEGCGIAEKKILKKIKMIYHQQKA